MTATHRHLVVIGAQRCGTTYLHDLLAAHPQIAMARPTRPEPKVFLSDEVADRGRGWYVETYFGHATDEPVLGEKSTSYLEYPEVADRVAAARAAAPPPEPTRIVLRPAAVKDAGFTVDATGEQSFVVHGDRPERWVVQTDFGNDEAVGYLADRLARLGVEDALADLGAKAGAEVTIGDVTFDWVPTLRAGAAPMGGRRGSDPRLKQPSRDSRDRAPERKAARKARRTSYDDSDDKDQT